MFSVELRSLAAHDFPELAVDSPLDAANGREVDGQGGAQNGPLFDLLTPNSGISAFTAEPLVRRSIGGTLSNTTEIGRLKLAFH